MDDLSGTQTIKNIRMFWDVSSPDFRFLENTAPLVCSFPTVMQNIIPQFNFYTTLILCQPHNLCLYPQETLLECLRNKIKKERSPLGNLTSRKLRESLVLEETELWTMCLWRNHLDIRCHFFYSCLSLAQLCAYVCMSICLLVTVVIDCRS